MTCATHFSSDELANATDWNVACGSGPRARFRQSLNDRTGVAAAAEEDESRTARRNAFIRGGTVNRRRRKGTDALEHDVDLISKNEKALHKLVR